MSKRGLFGNYDVVFAPTLGKYRGRARQRYPNERDSHAVCKHEHSSPEAALNCAAKIARAAAIDNWRIK